MFHARLSCLYCQALAAYLMFSDKLNDDDGEVTSVRNILICICLTKRALDACAVKAANSALFCAIT